MPNSTTPLNLNEEFGNHKDPGTHFQKFAAELFAKDYPGLTEYTAAGRDGGIDLFHADSGTVFECKFIGEYGATAAEQRWNETCRRLQDNLLPDRPKQSQYAPWYSQNKPIRIYRFCTSNRFENESRRQALQVKIQTFFHSLGQSHDSLKHLANINVDVWSEDSLQPLLQRYPALRLKWFGLSNPKGLKKLTADEPPQNNFRDYLDESRLPFYSQPKLDPEYLYPLLRELPVGYIAHGEGGVGKTRLMRELGLYALRMGHAVYSVHKNIESASLIGLAREANGASVLLLMDYIEQLPDFETLIGDLEQCNADGADIRIFATCRNSHFVTHRSSHSLKELPLDVFDRQAVVRHILSPVSEQIEALLNLCHGIPILAVFLRYLHDNQKTTELHSLLNEDNFCLWWENRLPSTSDTNLRLLALYPCEDKVLDALAARCPETQKLHLQLCSDGWVYEDAADNTWHLAHDLLADQTLLRHLQIPGTRRSLVRQILQDALACQAEESCVLALRRIAAHFPDTPWFKLFHEQAKSWRPYLPLLLTGNLFSVEERLNFLDLFADEAAELTADPKLRGVLGWIARQYWTQAIAPTADSSLPFWLDAAMAQELSNNFILTQALHWHSQHYAAPALAWLQTHPPSIQTHFLLCAWLDAGLPAADIAEPVRLWLEGFNRSPWATFVLRSWLDAGQDSALIKSAISEWLSIRKNRLASNAQFVYKAWLDATQDGALVRKYVVDWLEEEQNRLSPEAGFIYKAWLDATQDGALVKQAVVDWLAVEPNRLSPEAQFVYKAWLDATQDGVLVKQAVVDWLAVELNPLSPEARFVYKAWLDATQDGTLVKQAVIDWLALEQNRRSPEARFVYKAWLDATQDGALVRQAVVDWLAVEQNRRSPEAGFVYRAWLDAKAELKVIETAVFAWLAHADNATELGAHFIYRAWGDAEKALPVEMLPYACAWLRAHATEADAAYCLKHIAKAISLDADSARAVLLWCKTFYKHEDAFNRLSLLQENLQLLPIAEVQPIWQAILAWRLAEQRGLQRFDYLSLRKTFHLLHTMAERDADEAAMEKLVDCFAYCLMNSICFSLAAEADKGGVHDTVFPDFAVRLLRRKNLTPSLIEGLRDLLAWFDIWSDEEKNLYCAELKAELQG